MTIEIVVEMCYNKTVEKTTKEKGKNMKRTIYESTIDWKYTLIDCFGNHIKTNEELFFSNVGYDRKACPMEYETPNKQIFKLNDIVIGYRERIKK